MLSRLFDVWPDDYEADTCPECGTATLPGENRCKECVEEVA